MPIIVRRPERRQSSEKWAEENPTLLDGEEGWDTTLKNLKIGDGETAWNDLPYRLATIASSTPDIQPANSVWLKPLS